MDRVRLTINDVKVEAERGTPLLQVARKAGIYIPTLCSRPDLSLPLGGCRLCVVEMEGGEFRFPTSCTTPVSQDIVVRTDTPAVREIRRHNLVAVLAPLPPPRLGRTELRKLADYLEVREEDLPPYIDRDLPVDRSQPLFELNHNRCILCGLCVRVCRETRGVGAIGFVFQNGRLGIGPYPAHSLDENGCRFCGACVEVCPTGALTYKMGKIPADEAGVAPCTHACPAGIDIPRYVGLVGQRKFADAAAVVREKVPFPGVLGQVCPHPCEEECLRGQLSESVSICALKRVAVERDTQLWRSGLKRADPSGKRVAIVGSGPAGLTAGYYLAKLGHGVTVFELSPKPGGMMHMGIPEYRLPRTVLFPEMEEIKRVGVEIKTNTRVECISDLFKEGYHAVLLAVGAHKALKLNVPGNGNRGILEAVSLLRDINLGAEIKLRGKVGVIGGGSVAVDAARASMRLGAQKVELVCLESREEMPAYEEEIQQAVEEGVLLNCSWGVKRIVGEGENVRRIECVRCVSVFDDHGKFNPKFDKRKRTSFDIDTLIVAIGQVPDLSLLGLGSRVQSTEAGTIKVRDDFATDWDGVFAAGDAVSGPSSVIEAIAMGRKAATSVDRYLGGKGVISESLVEVEEPSPCLGPLPGFANLKRVQMPCLPVRQRLGFVQVETGLDEQTAVEEASRCLQCQLRFQIQAMETPPSR